MCLLVRDTVKSSIVRRNARHFRRVLSSFGVQNKDFGAALQTLLSRELNYVCDAGYRYRWSSP